MENRGFTLIELVSALAISAILGLIAVPALNSLIQQQQLRSAAHDLHRLLNSARATAITHQSRTSVWNQNGDWNSGVELFTDTSNFGQRESTETIVSRFADRPRIHISGNLHVADYVSYLPNGRAVKANGSFQTGTITLCKTGVSDKYQLVINIGGRLRLEKSAAVSCP